MNYSVQNRNFEGELGRGRGVSEKDELKGPRLGRKVVWNT